MVYILLKVNIEHSMGSDMQPQELRRLLSFNSWINQTSTWGETVFTEMLLLLLLSFLLLFLLLLWWTHFCPLCSACGWYQSCYHRQGLSSHEGEGSPEAKQGVCTWVYAFVCVSVGCVCVSRRESVFMCALQLHNKMSVTSFCFGK